MTTDALAPAAVMTRTWRVTPDRTDVVPTLRDYLRRLGASVEVGEAGAVEFATAEPDHEIDEWVAAWVETNEIVVRLDRVELSAPLLLPLPQNPETPRLGELLVRKGFITDDQLAWALGEARATNELLGIVLLRERMIQPPDSVHDNVGTQRRSRNPFHERPHPVTDVTRRPPCKDVIGH